MKQYGIDMHQHLTGVVKPNLYCINRNCPAKFLLQVPQKEIKEEKKVLIPKDFKII